MARPVLAWDMLPDGGTAVEIDGWCVHSKRSRAFARNAIPAATGGSYSSSLLPTGH